MNYACLAAAFLLAAAPLAASAQEQETAPTVDENAADGPATDDAADQDKQWAELFLARLDRKSGKLPIAEAKTTLDIPDNYYFLDAEDARAVLEEAWGNPPDETVLGMLLPADMTPLDAGAWAAIFTYEEEGYVSDKDAGKIDYDDLMKTMQADTAASNEWRVENGYGKLDLVGWAEPPGYNAETHKLYWAKELKFESADSNTLNYDIRVLGRKGVLVIRFVANMTSLPQIREAAPSVLDIASFDEGVRYADFKKGDKVAAYGLAGLIAGGLIAKKTGLLAALLIFGKKFLVLILGGLAAAVAWLKKKFPGAK